MQLGRGGDYWIVAAGQSVDPADRSGNAYDWAIVTGGAPARPVRGGGCATGSRLGPLRRFTTNNVVSGGTGAASTGHGTAAGGLPAGPAASGQSEAPSHHRRWPHAHCDLPAPPAAGPVAVHPQAGGCREHTGGRALGPERGGLAPGAEAPPLLASPQPLLPPPPPLPASCTCTAPLLTTPTCRPRHPAQLMTAKLAELGLDASGLVDVQQQGCLYEGAPGTGAGR